MCVVTGAAQGVGWAVAQALADYGGLVFTCDVSEEHIAANRKQLQTLPFGDSIRISHVDVSDREAVERWINGIYQRHGRIDVLVNNAAYVRWEPIGEMTVEDDLRTMRVGYDAMVYTTHAVLPIMLKQGSGSIVNMGSSAGKIYAGGVSAAYAAMKAAIDAYSQVLYGELRRTPVRVTVVRPGVIAGTNFFKKNVPSSRLPRLGDYVPYLTPPMVAEAIVDAILSKRHIVDIPKIVWLSYAFFAVAPDAFRRFLERFGAGRRDYGAVDWTYTPRSLTAGRAKPKGT